MISQFVDQFKRYLVEVFLSCKNLQAEKRLWERTERLLSYQTLLYKFSPRYSPTSASTAPIILVPTGKWTYTPIGQISEYTGSQPHRLDRVNIEYSDKQKLPLNHLFFFTIAQFDKTRPRGIQLFPAPTPNLQARLGVSLRCGRRPNVPRDSHLLSKLIQFQPRSRKSS